MDDDPLAEYIDQWLTRDYEALGYTVIRVPPFPPQERLAFHREHSRPRMVKLLNWFRHELRARRIEPNSPLGEAIAYMKRHWFKLTLFYRRAGAPLDNNICERALKKAILHRKNALFYKTDRGAGVGDLFMSLIYTAELSGVDPFDYLTELQRHAKKLVEEPADWMPWNYRDTLARLSPAGVEAL